jgi:hypothetical protein
LKDQLFTFFDRKRIKVHISGNLNLSVQLHAFDDRLGLFPHIVRFNFDCLRSRREHRRRGRVRRRTCRSLDHRVTYCFEAHSTLSLCEGEGVPNQRIIGHAQAILVIISTAVSHIMHGYDVFV